MKIHIWTSVDSLVKHFYPKSNFQTAIVIVCSKPHTCGLQINKLFCLPGWIAMLFNDLNKPVMLIYSMFSCLQAKDGQKGDGSGLTKKDQSSVQHVKSHRKPEEIRKQRVIFFFFYIIIIIFFLG